MTAAQATPAISPRCVRGEHNRCPGLLPAAFCGCSCGHPATRNVRAAGAVVLHHRAAYDNDRMFHAQAREMLEMLGLVDGRDITADDLRANNLGGAHQATGGSAGERPLRSIDGDFDEDAVASSKPVTTPPGLRVLPPAAAAPKPDRPEPKRAATARPKKRPAPKRAQVTPDPTSDEKTRLIAAGVNPASAAVLAAGAPKSPPDSGAPRPPRQLKPIRHGTLTGYTTHSQRKIPIPPDDPCGCRAARKAYDDARTAAKKRNAPKRQPLPPGKPSKDVPNRQMSASQPATDDVPTGNGCTPTTQVSLHRSAQLSTEESSTDVTTGEQRPDLDDLKAKLIQFDELVARRAANQ